MKENKDKDQTVFKNVWNILYFGISLGIAVLLVARRGLSLFSIRWLIINQLVAVAGIYDWNTRTIPDQLHGLLILAGLLEIQWIPAILGLLTVPLPFFIAALYTKGKVGGGDIKLLAALGFCYGVTKGIAITIYGLLIGICWCFLFGRGQKTLPLAPFLAVGCMLVSVLR